METPRDDDRPVEADDVTALDDPGFGEHDEARQEAEWEEDAEEGGTAP